MSNKRAEVEALLHDVERVEIKDKDDGCNTLEFWFIKKNQEPMCVTCFVNDKGFFVRKYSDSPLESRLQAHVNMIIGMKE